jgi:hypothetical protein
MQETISWWYYHYICYDRIAIAESLMFDSGVCVLKLFKFLFDMLMASYCYNVGGFSYIIHVVTGMVTDTGTFRAWVI